MAIYKVLFRESTVLKIHSCQYCYPYYKKNKVGLGSVGFGIYKCYFCNKDLKKVLLYILICK